jgi:hypothetical protein
MLLLKRIVRYLKGSQDKGLLMEPSKDISFDCYVDADFVGLYGYEEPQNPLSVKSRTGYVLMLANCPLLWVSKMQSKIAASTMEAEYVDLSQSIHDLIPMKRMTSLVCDTVFGNGNYMTCMHSKIFEDNNGALQLARSPRITPRTKNYAIKYHFFKRHVDREEIKLFKINTKDQIDDIFTKGLTTAIFELLHRKLMGW